MAFLSRRATAQPEVVIIVSGQEPMAVAPARDPIIVPSGQVIIRLTGQARARLWLDGAPLDAVTVGSDRIISLDFTRSVGFHLLRIDDSEYSFATSDAKLKLDGITNVANALDPASVVAWDRQILYSDGGRFSSPQVRYAWLVSNLPAVAHALESIVRSPRAQFDRNTVISPNLSGQIDVRATLHFLQRYPQALEPRKDGVISWRRKRFTPNRVAVRRRKSSQLIPPNFHAYALGRNVMTLCDSLHATLPTQQWKNIMPLMQRLRAVLSQGIFREIASAYGHRILPPPIGREYISDVRYATVAAKLHELASIGWTAENTEAAEQLAFIRHADEIFQVFVASCLARLLDCQPVHSAILPRYPGPMFQGSRYDIYYDTEPPSGILCSWRARSSAPDHARPDLLIVDRQTDCVLLVDAKYRNSGNVASADSLKELQYYMNSFQLTRCVVCYPPEDQSFSQFTCVRGRGNLIVEIPIAPHPDNMTFLDNNVGRVVQRLLR